MGLKVTSVGGGNTTDDPINNRDLLAANERRENEYRSEHRMQKHFERGTKGAPKLRAFIETNYPLVQSPGTSRTIVCQVFLMGCVHCCPYMEGPQGDNLHATDSFQVEVDR